MESSLRLSAEPNVLSTDNAREVGIPSPEVTASKKRVLFTTRGGIEFTTIVSLPFVYFPLLHESLRKSTSVAVVIMPSTYLPSGSCLAKGKDRP